MFFLFTQWTANVIHPSGHSPQTEEEATCRVGQEETACGGGNQYERYVFEGDRHQSASPVWFIWLTYAFLQDQILPKMGLLRAL